MCPAQNFFKLWQSMGFQSGIKLPRILLEEVGQERKFCPDVTSSQGVNSFTGRHAKTLPRSGARHSRKDRRKAARVEKKASKSRGPDATNSYKSQSSLNSLRLKHPLEAAQRQDRDKQDIRSDVSTAERATVPMVPKSPALGGKLSCRAGSENDEGSSHLDDSDSSSKRVHASQMDIPKAHREKLAQDDIEIKALEKALGIKGRLPRSFTKDGLEDLLDGLGESGEKTDGSSQLREEELEWLMRKRCKALKERPSKIKESVSDEGDVFHSNFNVFYSEETPEQSCSADDVFKGFPDEPGEQQQGREDPYKAPVESARESSQVKYIPPSLRTANRIVDPSSYQTRRHIQGLLNKLSDTNLLSMLSELERIYRQSARQVVSTSLIDFLMGLICGSSSLSDAFLVLYAGFVASVYKIVGTDFGAQVIQRIVEDFDRYESSGNPVNDLSKPLSNIISFLAELYNFQVVTSGLMYDYIRQFVSNISETNTELLLRIIRHSGSQLRQDDPTSLRDIVIQLQSAVAKIGKGSLSIRTQFMLETIGDLKNNKLKTGIASSNLLSEHIIKMKKLIGSLNTRSLKAREPLHITIDDIKNSKERGKWWLVGSSYRDKVDTEEPRMESISGEAENANHLDKISVDLLRLAKDQRMNTNIRRSIFVTIMSATDYKDAQLRLLKLNLKRSQELEIPKILIHCASMEETFNPYYSLIATQLCTDRRFKMAFQFSLWDLFKRMGEESESETGEADTDVELDMRTIVNLSRMYGSLVSNDRLGLSIFKNLKFMYLRPKSRIFLEVLFISFIVELRRKHDLDWSERRLRGLILEIEDNMNLVSGLQYFIAKVLRMTDVASNKKEQKAVLWGCDVLEDALDATKLDT